LLPCFTFFQVVIRFRTVRAWQRVTFTERVLPGTRTFEWCP
jgi:hypothetical protein